MNREEILAKSREENKSADERQQSLHRRAQAISSFVGLILCCIIAFLEGILGETTVLLYGCFSIYWGIIATNSIVLAIIGNRKYGWIAGVNVLFFLGFMIKLILELI